MKISYLPIINKIYGDDYYLTRNLNCEKRLKQMDLDGDFLRSKKSSGVICDVGCSTGEFLSHIKWQGQRYGMEVNSSAIKQAQKRGVSFEKNIFTESEFFDVVVFRGTIQHVDEPFRMMKLAYASLKKGGIICFLATPNTDSIVYRIKRDLPFLTNELNFYVPGEKNLTNALHNIGFKKVDVIQPYWHTPYRRFISDHFYFALNVLTKRFYNHAFWGSSMSIIAEK